MAKRYVVRDGKIYARITYFDSTGKERQLWRRAQSKSEAKDLARDLAHNIKQFGTEALEHQLTLSDYLDKWLKSLRLSPRTHTAYETVLRLYVRPKLGNSIPETCKALQISRTTLWKLVRSRRLKPLRIGRRVLFTTQALEEFLIGDRTARR